MSQVDLNTINHFVLQKQHLADDAKSDDIVHIVRDISGLHATRPTTPYLSLFARTEHFTREQLDDELSVKRSLGKIRCVRRTVYILPRERMPIAYAATKAMVVPVSERYSGYLGVNRKEYEEIAQSIVKILNGKGLTAKELKSTLGTTLNVSAIVNLMCDQGLLIRGMSQKGWKSNLHTYYALHTYFPDMDLNAVDEAEAKKSVVKHYLASFGPVTENDVAWWTGFPKGHISPVLGSLRDTITPIDRATSKDTYWMLASDEDRLKSVKIPKKHVVNVLSSLDPYLMGYKDRERYLSQDYYDNVFDRSGNATSTILLDGRVIGVWDFAEPLVKIFLFRDCESRVLRELYSKAQNIGRFISGKEVQLKKCDSMVPLTQRTAGGVMTPLRNC
jgi:hypothetical protein